jgi:hypothetical protein
MLRLLALCLALACAATAAPGQTPAAPPAEEAAAPLRLMELSRRLYEAGRALEDPVLLVAAAQLRRSVDLRPATPRGGAGAAAADAAVLTWQAILDAAKAIGGDDPEVARLIEEVEAERPRGLLTGPVYSITVLEGQLEATYGPYTFAAGRYAEVYVEGDGSSNLDLFVYDAEGRLICADTDLSDIAHCGWRPAEDGDFTVVVRNRGSERNRYALMTN